MLQPTTTTSHVSETLSNTSDPSLSPCILYQTNSVTLIDIPTSIAHAQHTNTNTTSTSSLISCSPLTTPYPNHEPKSESARQKLRQKMATENHHVYTTLISSSLTALGQNYTGPWCLPRAVKTEPENPLPQKRKVNDASLETESSVDDLLEALSSDTTRSNSFRWRDLSNQHAADDSLPKSSPWPKYLHNASDVARILDINSSSVPDPAKFYIPPGAAFYLGNCSASRPFHMAVKDVAKDTPRRFHVVLMDPPWPNASVRRTEKSGKSAYQVASTIWDIRQLIFDMDVDLLLADQGIVAIWITNNPAVRHLVLGEDGLFESWDVQLEEEWLWIKTTAEGEPVSSVDALWRKPYEVLLIGRKAHATTSDQQNETHEVERRVIVGVPDLHSRKPCLKPLFNRFMVDPTSTSTNQRVLECFSRYLVAGWWSWGNQVIKFNHIDCWQS
jgi:N6-adenosine-specific RNA methylase IME4